MLSLLVFFPFAAGLVSFIAGKKNEKARDILVNLTVVIEFALMLIFFLSRLEVFAAGERLSMFLPEICGFGLNFTIGGFRAIYGCVAAFMWMMSTLISNEYMEHHANKNRYYFFILWTLGAAMGVFLSADLYTTFIFFEIMSFTSYVWVAQEETDGALRAASTYLAVAIIGGLVMLMGIFMLYYNLGTVNIAEMHAAAAAFENKKLLYAAGACLLVGFGAKAGAFPLHIWLPKAHPVAPAPASALLSGILTKTGIYGTLIISVDLFAHDAKWGALILGLGTITMFLGAVLGVFSVDLKRTLACSSMSQIGFIMTGIGMMGLLHHEVELAVHGIMLHLINHSMIKLVLFMAAGVVYMNAHKLNLNDIRGYGRKKPMLKIVFAIGGLTIAGVPLLGGYVSKTLLHEAIVEFGGSGLMTLVEWIFLISGGLTLAYMLKLFIAVFVEKNADDELQKQYDNEKNYLGKTGSFALVGSALALLVWGVVPSLTMDRAAALGQKFMGIDEYGHAVNYFTLGNLSGSLISIAIGLAVYLLFIRKVLMNRKDSRIPAYADRWPEKLDLENLIYRPLMLVILPTVFGFLCRILDSAADFVIVLLRKTVYSDTPVQPADSEMVLSRFDSETSAASVYKGADTYASNVRSRLKTYEKNSNKRIIRRSISFALILATAGIVVFMLILML